MARLIAGLETYEEGVISINEEVVSGPGRIVNGFSKLLAISVAYG
ncbi:hypothetical protein THIOSC15_2640016 [uncultured Thiomicrorhabdus sp.]